MQTGPFAFVAWWQISTVANAINSLACFSLVIYIAITLTRRHQLRKNTLAVATMVVGFLLGAQRGLQVIYQVIQLLGPDAAAYAAQQRNVWWLSLIQVLIAAMALYFMLRRGVYGRLLIEAFLFDAFTQQEHQKALEVQSALRAAQEEAEAERDFHANMMKNMNQNSHTLVHVKDLEGRYIMVNANFESTFGVQEESILGQTVEVIDPARADEFRAYDERARSGLFRVEETARAPDGLHYFDTVRFPVFSGTGELQGTAAISLDVTELRRTIVDLSVARDAALAAGQAKSDFLATMSHEIRTPMNAVIGMTDLLLHTQLDQQQRELLDTVESSGMALLTLIDDILDLSKIEAGEMKIVVAPFDLRALVEECVDLVSVTAATKGLDLVTYLDDSCPATLLGDAARVRQICINLLGNAIKFTSRGEVLITVRTSPRSEGGLDFIIEIADTGIGITTDGIQHLFTPFSQVDTSTSRAYGGTGLGLAISRRLARAMDGDITVVSRFGSGSAFTVTVASEAVVEEGAGVQPDPLDTPLTGVRVLLVDDNATNLRVLELQLEIMGLRCGAFLTAREALVAIEDGRRFDLALLDVNMPETGGRELAAKLKDIPATAAMPVILVTSAGSSRDHDGSTTTLATPIKKAALNHALVTALRDTRLPAVDTSATPLAVPDDERLHVLLAEDNLVNQRVAQLMLDKLGHTVDTVADGAAACQAVDSHSYDVVLMDVNMPIMNGIEATLQIRKRSSQQRQPFIIALTADATEENRLACAAAGMNDHLNKPVHIQSLKATLGHASTQAHRSSVGQPR